MQKILWKEYLKALAILHLVMPETDEGKCTWCTGKFSRGDKSTHSNPECLYIYIWDFINNPIKGP